MEALGRVAYGTARLGFVGITPNPQEVTSATIVAGGAPGEWSFVKVDATLHAANNRSERVAFVVTRDGSTDTSIYQQISVDPYTGTSASVSWVVRLPAGTQETFRLKYEFTPYSPTCETSNSCTRHDLDGVITATAMPFGSTGTTDW